jgi:hypothetical protein
LRWGADVYCRLVLFTAHGCTSTPVSTIHILSGMLRFPERLKPESHSKLLRSLRKRLYNKDAHNI